MNIALQYGAAIPRACTIIGYVCITEDEYIDREASSRDEGERVHTQLLSKREKERQHDYPDGGEAAKNGERCEHCENCENRENR